MNATWRMKPLIAKKCQVKLGMDGTKFARCLRPKSLGLRQAILKTFEKKPFVLNSFKAFSDHLA